MKKLIRVTSVSVMAISLSMAQPERAIRLRARGAEPNVIRARAKDRVVWRGTDWRITFTGKSPCQNGKSTFSSTETGLDRICIISVPCSEADKSGCGKYKYTSQAEGGQPIDPEIDVEL